MSRSLEERCVMGEALQLRNLSPLTRRFIRKGVPGLAAVRRRLQSLADRANRSAAELHKF